MNKFSTICMTMLLILTAIWPVVAVNSGDDRGHAVLYENKYYDNNPAIREVLPVSAYGYVIFYVRGVTVQDPFVFIYKEGMNITPDYRWHPDHTNITGQNDGMMLVKIRTDGVSDPIMLSSGNYTAFIRQGNADQTEIKEFKIGGGGTERIVFLGAAIPSEDRKTCKKFTILDNESVPGWTEHLGDYSYIGEEYVYVGAGNGDYIRTGSGDPYVLTYHEPVYHEAVYEEVCHAEVNHTVEHPATTHEEYVEEVNHTVHHDAITHEEFVVDGHYYVHDWKYVFGQGWKVKCTNHAEHGDGWHFETSDCSKAYGHYVTITDTPAWDEIVVDVAGHWVTVTDKEAWTETVVDEPAYCEQVLVSEAYTEHFGDYDAQGNYVGAGQGDYTRSGSGDPYVYTYVAPIEHPSVPAVTHTVVVCNPYGEPAVPKGAIPEQA